MTLLFAHKSVELLFPLKSLAAFIAAGLVFYSSPLLAEEDISPSAFLQSYRSVIKEQIKNQGGYQLEGKLRHVMDRQDGKPPFRDNTIELFCSSNGHQRSLRFVSLVPEYVDRKFILRESAISFGMRSPAVGKKYGLEFIDQIPPSMLTHNHFLGDAPRSIGTQLITPLLESPGFTVKKARKISSNGRDVVRVVFDYRPLEPKSEYDMAGELTLDPSNDLAILDYSVKRQIALSDGPYYREIIGSVAYSKVPGCRLLPESGIVIEKGSTATQPKLKIIQEFHADKVSDVAPADSEFSPEHYGLASLDRPRARPGNYTPYWAFGIALVAIGLTVLLRRLSK